MKRGIKAKAEKKFLRSGKYVSRKSKKKKELKKEKVN
jgi:hypothetical protein